MSSQPVLLVDNLSKQFGQEKLADSVRPGFRNISIQLKGGEAIGLVGESGCGKTTLARSLVRLLEPDSGKIYVEGQDFTSLRGSDLRRFRRKVQIVFQRPETSLNPRMTVATFVSEVFRNFGTVSVGHYKDRLVELTRLVGLTEDHLQRYPHQLSGGEKQRVGIMRALACEPSVIILDEPTSALDVSVQAQVLKTLRQIQEETQTAFILISHDVAVVRYMCSRVLVMYLGQIVEEGPTHLLFSSPKHPYTQALFDSVPRLHGEKERQVILSGEATTRNVRASACPLEPRCPFRMEKCLSMPPTERFGGGHLVACWLVESGSESQEPMVRSH